MPGRYHFRFKTPLIPGTDREKNAVSVWMDCVDDNQHVGVWRNTIFAKVTRISMEDDDDDDDYNFRAAGATNHINAATNGSVPGQNMARSHSNTSSVISNPAGAAASAHATMQQSSQPTSSVPAPTPAPTENLLGVFDEPPTSSSHSSDANFLDVGGGVGVGGDVGGGGAEGSLLDMTGPTYYNSGSSANNSNHDDFLGMTSQPVPLQSMGNAGGANGHGPQVPVSGPMSYNGYGGGGGVPSGVKPVAPGVRNNAFDSFSNNNGPFGGLQWK
jgi:hypothetical protein